MAEELIGKNIKLLRKKKGLTLQDLEGLTGLTSGYISKIERSKKSPPYSTVSKLATALGVRIDHLSSEKTQKLDDPRVVFVKNVEVKAEKQYVKNKGYHYQALAPGKIGKNMDPYIIEPDFDEPAIFQHEGEEFLYVLEGKHEFTYDGKTYIMEKGDSIYYDANVPHTGKSIGKKRAILLAVNYNYKRL